MAEATDLHLLRLPQVLARVGISRAQCYRMRAAGTFPPPLQLSARTIAWRSDDLDAWIRDRARARAARVGAARAG